MGSLFPNQGYNLSPLQWKCGVLTTGPPVVKSVSHSVKFDSLRPHGHNLQGSSVHEIFQVRILEWVAILFSRGSPQLRDQTQVSCIAGGFFTV